MNRYLLEDIFSSACAEGVRPEDMGAADSLPDPTHLIGRCMCNKKDNF